VPSFVIASVKVNVWPTVGLGGSSATATRSGTLERCGDGLATASGEGLADRPEAVEAAEGEATLTATTADGEATTAGSALGGPGGGCACRQPTSPGSVRTRQAARAARTALA
jgi:hypothetical protein